MPAISTGSTLPSLIGNATATENPSFRNPTPAEQRAVAGIFAAWTGSILLADLAQEHFHLPPEEPQPRRDEEDDEEDEE